MESNCLISITRTNKKRISSKKKKIFFLNDCNFFKCTVLFFLIYYCFTLLSAVPEMCPQMKQKLFTGTASAIARRTCTVKRVPKPRHTP